MYGEWYTDNFRVIHIILKFTAMKESNNKSSSRATNQKAGEKTSKTTTSRAASRGTAQSQGTVSGNAAHASRSNNPEGYNQYTKKNTKK